MTITVHTPPRPMTFLEIAEHFLGSSDIEVIKKHTLTREAVMEFAEGEHTGMATDGRPNLYFRKEKDGNVSVGYVYRGALGWNDYDVGLADGDRWFAAYRVLLGSYDPKTLSPSDSSSDVLARLAKLEAFYERAVELIPSLASLSEQ